MKSFGQFCSVNYSYVNLIKFNKVLFWIFVWFLKTWKKSFPLSEKVLFNIVFSATYRLSPSNAIGQVA